MELSGRTINSIPFFNKETETNGAKLSIQIETFKKKGKNTVKNKQSEIFATLFTAQQFFYLLSPCT